MQLFWGNEQKEHPEKVIMATQVQNLKRVETLNIISGKLKKILCRKLAIFALLINQGETKMLVLLETIWKFLPNFKNMIKNTILWKQWKPKWQVKIAASVFIKSLYKKQQNDQHLYTFYHKLKLYCIQFSTHLSFILLEL